MIAFEETTYNTFYNNFTNIYVFFLMYISYNMQGVEGRKLTYFNN